MKGRTFISIAVVAVLAAGAFGATMDYNGFGGVMTPADWAEINVQWDPGSYTGVFRWPTTGDTANVRNGATTALNTLLEADQFSVGGNVATAGDGGPVIPMPASRLDLRDGAELKLVTGADVDFAIGDGYYGIVNQYAGSLVTLNETGVGDQCTKFNIASSGTNTAGVYNLYGGTIQTNAGYQSYMNIGNSNGATGVFNMYDGLVDLYSTSKGNVYVGRGTGHGTLNMMGGSFIQDGSDQKAHITVGDYSGEGHLNMTGGYMFVGKRLYLGYNKSATDYAYGYASFTGGTYMGRNAFVLGRGDESHTAAGTTGEGHVTFGQGASVLVNDWIYSSGGIGSTEEWLLDSDSDFDISFKGNVMMRDMNTIITVDASYTPSIGQKWKLITDCEQVIWPDMGTITSNYGLPGEWSLLEGVNLANSLRRDLVLQYIPEPATLSFLVLGGLALIRRRR